jgi:hypothetical protein
MKAHMAGRKKHLMYDFQNEIAGSEIIESRESARP